VTVLDVNDNAPVLEEDEILITITEGEELRQTLLTLTATDADVGVNSEIVYSLTGGDGESLACMHACVAVTAVITFW
jgi:hypothetical protein